LIKTISLSPAPGGEEYYDYIRVDAVARRGYVSHGTEAVLLNAHDYSVVGKIEGLSRSQGIAAAGAAQALATSYDFTRDHKVIDIGGGTGSFLVSILTRHSHLQGTLFELPTVTSLATQRLASSSVGSRIAVQGGDFLKDRLPAGHDAAIVANIIHGHSPQQNKELFRAIRNAMEPGARVLIVDFWTNPTHTDPVFAALMAGEFLVGTGAGDIYSRSEGEDWLRQTGWRPVDQLPLAGPSSVLVGEGV
jgi:hypothetical protein